MFSVKNILKLDNQKEDLINSMLSKVPGINFPGLYDEYFLGIEVEDMTTMNLINRLNFEQNVLFKKDYLASKELFNISIAEAIAFIYEVTTLPIQQQRLSKSLTSVDNIIGILEMYLLDTKYDQHVQTFVNLTMPSFCPSFEAFIDNAHNKDRIQTLLNIHKNDRRFSDVLYSSIPIAAWFDSDNSDLLKTIDEIVAYNCIEMIYFKDDNDALLHELSMNKNYKIIMCGKVASFNSVMFHVTKKPDPADIATMKDSYKEFYKN